MKSSFAHTGSSAGLCLAIAAALIFGGCSPPARVPKPAPNVTTPAAKPAKPDDKKPEPPKTVAPAPEVKQPVEAPKPEDKKPEEVKPVEAPKPEEKKPDEVKPVEAPKPEEKKPEDKKPEEKKSEESKPAPAVAEKVAPKKLTADPLDWPTWRGPESNSISRETGLPDTWDPEGGAAGNVAWKNKDIWSNSTPIVMHGKLYVLARKDPGKATEGERVVCLDAATGQLVWENKFNVSLSDVPDTRVSWSSVVGDPTTGYVYAQGVNGLFMCLDGETGKTVWSLPLHEQFGLVTTYGGRTNLPIIFEDMVLISGVLTNWGENAKPAHRFLGFDKLTGECRWLNGTTPLPEDTTYSTPVVKVIEGKQQLIFTSGDGGIWGFQPRTGQKVWEYKLSRRGINVSPVVVDELVYAAHGEENLSGNTQGGVVCVKATGAKGDISANGAVWFREQIEEGVEATPGKSSPIVYEGRVYLMDDKGKLYIMDAKTGEPVAPRKALGKAMRGTPLLADGKLYIFMDNGRWYIFEIDPKEDSGLKELASGMMPSGDECNASPICSHGRIYLSTTNGLYCIEDTKKQKGSKPIPEATKETGITDMTPAQVQILPAEVLVSTAQGQKFRVRLYNAAGQLVKEDAEAKFELAGPGTISADGNFTAPAEMGFGGTIVKAKVGEVEGTARVRIVPPLPWSFDFEKITLSGEKKLGEPPLAWIGARHRHNIREMDGSKVMAKVTTIPKGQRSRAWFGPSDMHDYTIQADVKGAFSNNFLPDIGLIAQGFTLSMRGQHQKLTIASWDSLPYDEKGVEFKWVPDKWYTMKFRAEQKGDKQVLKGKVWVKGEKEPDAWTLENEVTGGQTHGSPGLFGDAKVSELYLDNITVTAN